LCAGLPFAPSVPSWDNEPGYLLVDRMCWLSWWSAATLCVSKCAMLYCYIWSCKLLCRQLTSVPGATPGQGMWLEERRSASVIVFVRPSSCAWHGRCCSIITSSVCTRPKTPQVLGVHVGAAAGPVGSTLHRSVQLCAQACCLLKAHTSAQGSVGTCWKSSGHSTTCISTWATMHSHFWFLHSASAASSASSACLSLVATSFIVSL
jgi:hypothetical protein